MITIRNSNFIAPVMVKRDIQSAFLFEGKVSDFIWRELIENGWIVRKSDRYFKPTEKLLDLAFLPSQIVLSEGQRRALEVSTTFAKEELVEIFENLQIVKKLIKMNLLKVGADKRFRKSAELEHLLVEGETLIQL